EVLEQGVSKVGETSLSVMKRIDEAFAEFREHASTLNTSAAETVKAVRSLLNRIEKIEAPSDIVTKRLGPALDSAEKIAARLSERLEKDETLMQGYAARVSTLQQEVQAATDGFRGSLATLGSVGGKAREAQASAAEASQRMAQLLTSVADTMTKQIETSQKVLAESGLLSEVVSHERRRFGEESTATLQRLTEQLKQHNASLENELDRSKNLLNRMSHALVELADYVTQKVAEPV